MEKKMSDTKPFKGEYYRDRFDLETDIMSCWSVVEDIKELNRSMLDRRKMTEDEISNYLLGLESIYQVKFERLFETFEKLVQQNAFHDRPNSTANTLD
jgi:hypothetical protein